MARLPKKPNWEKIRAAYEAGEGSYRELAVRFKVSFNTLKDRAIRESWAKGTQQIHNTVRNEVTTKIVQQRVDRALKDIDIVNAALDALYASLTVEAKSLEGAASAIGKLIQVKKQIAPTTARDILELAIASGVSYQDFVSVMQEWQLHQNQQQINVNAG